MSSMQTANAGGSYAPSYTDGQQYSGVGGVAAPYSPSNQAHTPLQTPNGTFSTVQGFSPAPQKPNHWDQPMMHEAPTENIVSELPNSPHGK